MGKVIGRISGAEIGFERAQKELGLEDEHTKEHAVALIILGLDQLEQMIKSEHASWITKNMITALAHVSHEVVDDEIVRKILNWIDQKFFTG